MVAYVYTISSSVDTTVTLGTSPYVGPLTITNTGAILPGSPDAIGLSILVPQLGNNNRVLNDGTIAAGGGAAGQTGGTGQAGYTGGNNYNYGGYGYNGTNGTLGGTGGIGDAGGVGVNIAAAASISNSARIYGAMGGAGGVGGTGGAGGDGGQGGPGFSNNYSSYQGGRGGYGGYGANGGTGGEGGAGGDGINITATHVSIGNTGYILAGSGGRGGDGGAGGAGGQGGPGGPAGSGFPGGAGSPRSGGYAGLGGNGGNGGDGIATGATPLGTQIVNYNRIQGGTGGDGGSNGDGAGGNGGIGIYGAGAQIANLSTYANSGIIGGNGGNGGYGGENSGGAGGDGGVGVSILSGTSLLNQSTLTGGAGGTGGYSKANYEGGGHGFSGGGNGGAGGAGLVMGTGDNSLTNTGLILGGTGGVAGDGATAGVGGAAISVIGTAYINNSLEIFGAEGSTGGAGIAVAAGGVLTLVNSGLVEGANSPQGGYGVLAGRGSYILNQKNGEIWGGTDPGGTSYGVGVILNGGTLVDAGVVGGGYNYPPSASHTYTAVSFGSDGGLLVIDPGADFVGQVEGNTAGSGPSVIELAGDQKGIITGFGADFAGFNTLSFATGAAWDVVGSLSGIAGGIAIDGFTFGDTLDISGFTITSLDYAGPGDVEISNGNRTVALDIEGSFAHGFTFGSDGAAGSFVEEAICYLCGTRILTPDGYKRIETLAIGDAVVTRFGGARTIEWIGRQSFNARFLRNGLGQVPVRIRAGALGENMPRADLWISGGHSVLLDGVLVLARALVNGVTITQELPGSSIEYYHIECGAHDCVMAENIWAESFADGPGLRAQFHNFPEYCESHPDYVAPPEVSLCAPRPEAGPMLAAAIAPVMARAAAGCTPGELHGYVEEVTPDGFLRGWAWDEANPNLPVLLEIWLGQECVGEVLACDPRGDLATAGYGLGQCGFTAALPPGVAQDRLSVRRVGDGAMLSVTHELHMRVLGRLAAA